MPWIVCKRKRKYSPESKKRHTRQSKELAKHLMAVSNELDIPVTKLRRFWLLPISARKYVFSVHKKIWS